MGKGRSVRPGGGAVLKGAGQPLACAACARTRRREAVASERSPKTPRGRADAPGATTTNGAPQRPAAAGAHLVLRLPCNARVEGRAREAQGGPDGIELVVGRDGLVGGWGGGMWCGVGWVGAGGRAEAGRRDVWWVGCGGWQQWSKQ